MNAPKSLAIDFAPTIAGKRRVICCHSGCVAPAAVPNSVDAVAEAVAAGAQRLEVDIQFLADDAIAVFHNRNLDDDSDTRGVLSTFTSDDLRTVRLNTGGRVAFLDEIVDVIRGSEVRLQVDMKPLTPITAGQRQALQDALAPIAGQALLGSRAYWSLRTLADSGIPLALDPQLLLCRFEGFDPPGGVYPSRVGLHGLWDDHPLAHMVGVTSRDYLLHRLQDLLDCLPSAVEWMVNVDTLLAMAAHGFLLGHELERHGIELAAWTLKDAGPEPTVALLTALVALGATTFITDHPVEVAGYAARVS